MQEYEISESDGVECALWLERFYADYVKEKNQYRPEWLRDGKEAQRALDTLDDKLEKGVISDERYKARSAKHEAMLARATELLICSDNDAARWLELAKETFATVTNIGDVFEMANDEERRRLMMHVGSNWYLTNKKVDLTPRRPIDLLRHRDNNLVWRARPDLNRRSPP